MPEIDLTTFKRVHAKMIAKNEQSWNNSRYGSNYKGTHKTYTQEEIDNIINSSSLASQQELSRNYYDINGLYRRIILHYATLLTYSGLLIPCPKFGKKLSTPHVSKRYYSALEYLNKIDLKEIMTRMSMRALIDGSYYGIIQTATKENFVMFDLPASYCRSDFVDIRGNDIVEFNVQYFNSIIDEEMRREALNTYPKMISSYYNKYSKGKVSSPWLKLPSDMGISFSFSNDGRPMFLDVISMTTKYDDAIETELEKAMEEIRKIIVQKIPHLADGTLLFVPEEAEVIHQGTVGMLKGNDNLSVLTSYADVDAIVSKTSSDNNSKTLENVLQTVYSEAGVSGQIFAPTGSQALSTSIVNDISLMMIMANKYAHFFTGIFNLLFGNSNISFKYIILPVSLHNQSDYITDTLKLAQSGYSFLLPAIAAGLNQSELVSIKELENDVLKLNEILIPLSSSYTQSSTKEVGAPEKSLEEKSEKTIKNQEAINNQGKGGTI